MPSALVHYIVIAAIAILGCAGCRQSAVEPPPTLAVERLDPVLQQAFTNAEPELRTEAEQYVKAMQKQDWPAAMAELKQLRSHPELTPEQRATLARVQQTTVRQLNDSADKGDESAAAVMSAYKASK